MLRVISTFGVLICHVNQRLKLPGILSIVAMFGAAGVDVFYMLSGYLVMKSYVSCRTKKDYWRKRLERTVPIYYFWLIVLIIFRLDWLRKDPFAIIRAVFWLEYLSPPTTSYDYCSMYLLGVLTIFMMYYVAVPFIAKVVTSLEKAFTGFWITILMAVLLGWAMTALYKPFCDAGQLHHMVRYLFRAFPYFAEGIILYWGKKENKTKKIFFMQAVILSAAIISSILYGIFFNPGLLAILDILEWPICAALVMAIVCFPMNLGKIGKFCIFFDRFGMSVFITQVLCFELAETVSFQWNLSYLPTLCLLIFLPYACAILVYYCVEIPGKHVVDKIFKIYANIAG